MGLKGVGKVLCAVVLVGWGASRATKSKDAPQGASALASVAATPTAQTRTAFKTESTTAARIAAAFENNEAAAEDHYKDLCLTVTGTVTSIDSGIGKEPTLHLRGGVMGVLISDVSREWAKTLNKGDEVIVFVKGVSEVLGQPVASYSGECQQQIEAAEAEAKAKAAEAKAAAKAKTEAAKAAAKPAKSAAAAKPTKTAAAGQ